MVARIYPLGGAAVENFLLPGAENETVVDLSKGDLHRVQVMDRTMHQPVTAHWERFAFEFEVEAGHRYSIAPK